jgi:hypothetical protein
VKGYILVQTSSKRSLALLFIHCTQHISSFHLLYVKQEHIHQLSRVNESGSRFLLKKKVPWFLPAIIPRLMSPSLTDLLENYSGIKRDEQEQHLLHVVLLIPYSSSQHKTANSKQRDVAWEIFSCIGIFWWLVLGLSAHPH